MKTLSRLFALLIPALVLAGLIIWRISIKKESQKQQNAAATARKSAPPIVSVSVASERAIIHAFDGVGTVDSPFDVKLGAMTTGRVDYLMVREGDHVTVGETIVRIDPSQVQGQIAQLQSEVFEAQQRLVQAQLTTTPTNVTVTSGIKNQQAGLASSKANYNQTKQNYNQQVAAAQGAVTDAQGKVDVAKAMIGSAQAGVVSAQANLDDAQAKYTRTEGLYKQGFVAAQDVDDAKTQVAVMKGALDVAQHALLSAQASEASANAQLGSANNQLNITKTKGLADIEAAKAVVDQSGAGLDLAQANRFQQPAYQANLASLKFAVDSAKGALKNAQAQLANTILKSPIDGFITGRMADPGTMATAGQTLVTIEQLNPIYVTTSVPEDIIRQVHVGMKATVAFDALPGQSFEGPITQFNPMGDPNSRQFTIRLTLSNPKGQIKPGMFSRVHLETDRITAITVPREAIHVGKSGSTATVVGDDMVAHKIPVKTGTQDATYIAVSDGLRPGDKVVTLSLIPVKDGQKVKIATTPAPGEAQSTAAAPTASAAGRM